MKTHVIPWMSKEETERLLQELKLEIGVGQIRTAAEKPVIDVPASVEPQESEDSKPAALDIGSL